MGRPSLLTDELKDRIVQSAEVIFHYKWVAKSVGIDEDTLLEYRKQDKDLSDRLEEARSRFIKENLKRAKPDFKLETADREIFGKQQKIELGKDPVAEILKAVGLTGGEGANEQNRSDDESIQSSSENTA